MERALYEDYRGSDLTARAVLPEGQRCWARVVAREPGLLCGVAVAEAVFRQLDPDLALEERCHDGDALQPGQVLLELQGRAQPVLAGERVALNFLQHLSGIASLAREYSSRASAHGVVILDTRKTIPGLRELEKYATRVGGVQNHRLGLFDAILIKDNHLDLAGGLRAALERATGRVAASEIEVEVRSLKELELALPFGVGRVLLDNFTPAEVAQAVALVAHRCLVEVSGGVNLENLDRYLDARPDYISVGRLTHSAPALDLALEVRAAPPG